MKLTSIVKLFFSLMLCIYLGLTIIDFIFDD